MGNVLSNSDEAWSATYPDAQVPSIWAELPFVRRALSVITERARGPVLEMPCGGGRNTVALAANVPFLLAADRSPAALAVAQSTLDRERIANCGLVEADIHRLPFPNRSIHGVFCADLLGHLRHPTNALAELVRVTRAGARIVANFFNENDPTRLDPEMRAIEEHEYIYRGIYFRFDDEARVRQIIGSCDLHILAIEHLTWHEDPHEGYRDYPHEHRTVLALLEVPE